MWPAAYTASNTDSYKQAFHQVLFSPPKTFSTQAPFCSRLTCIKFVRIPMLKEDDLPDCIAWQFDMIQLHISTDILTHSRHTSQGTDRESYKSDARAQKLLWSDTCSSGLLVREKASQQDHLTDADHQKDNGFSDGPERNTGVEVLCPTASLGLTEAEVCLVVDDRLQGLMDGHTGWFHLEILTKWITYWNFGWEWMTDQLTFNFDLQKKQWQ